MKPVKIVAPAEAELHEALSWYRERDVRVAERFATEAKRTLELIHEFTRIGSRVPDIDDPHVRRMPIHTFPYHIVFVEFEEQIEVIAFAHNRRRPGYFVKRLHRS